MRFLSSCTFFILQILAKTNQFQDLAVASSLLTQGLNWLIPCQHLACLAIVLVVIGCDVSTPRAVVCLHPCPEYSDCIPLEPRAKN